MERIIFREIPPGDLWEIRPLWEELNREAGVRTALFRKYYRGRIFADRERELAAKAAAGKIRVVIATEAGHPAPVAYCIATVSPGGAGEIDSIFVKKKFRGMGIGSGMISGALRWLRDSRVSRVTVFVSWGNEDAVAFYRKFGFAERLMVLQIPEG